MRLWDWLFEGKAIFHVVNDERNVEYVFKIEYAQVSNDFDGYFAHLVKSSEPGLGSRNGYIGMVNQDAPTIKLTSKSKWSEQSKPYKVLHWFLGLAQGDKDFPAGYSVITRRCGSCGAKLRDKHTDEFGVCDGSGEGKDKDFPKKVTVKVVKMYEQYVDLQVDSYEDAKEQIEALGNDDFMDADQHYTLEVFTEGGDDVTGDIQPYTPNITP